MALEANVPDLVERLLETFVDYLGLISRRRVILEHDYHCPIYRYSEGVTIVRVEDSEGKVSQAGHVQ